MNTTTRTQANRILRSKLCLCCYLFCLQFILWHSFSPSVANASTATNSWLELPADWQQNIVDGVHHASPSDLAEGEALILMIEPISDRQQSVEQDFNDALIEFPNWLKTPVGASQALDNGWVFYQGIGAVEINEVPFTAMVSVARHGSHRARFWTLASSDEVMNRYLSVVSNAISSVQDFALPNVKTPAIASVNNTTIPVSGSGLSPDFGKGISGVYVGMERGLSASAGAGAATTQNFDARSGRIESGLGITAQTQLSIGDYLEVDVFYPDGTYRRRLPIRGLASDFSWERQQAPILWGQWQQQGNRILVQRGDYRTYYTIENNQLVSERGEAWGKLALMPAATIYGRFVRADYRGPNVPSLTLNADGTYEDYDSFLKMIGSAFNLVKPDGDRLISQWSDAQSRQAMAGSRGRYRFEHFTLTLYADDGRIWQFSAFIPQSENKKSPSSIMINGRTLVRE